MGEMPVLLELEAAEPLSPYADGLALRLGSDGTVFVPRAGIDPRARSAVAPTTGIIVRIESSDAESTIADWVRATASSLSSGSISGKVGDRRRVFPASGRDTVETLRSLIGGE